MSLDTVLLALKRGGMGPEGRFSVDLVLEKHPRSTYTSFWESTEISSALRRDERIHIMQ